MALAKLKNEQQYNSRIEEAIGQRNYESSDDTDEHQIQYKITDPKVRK